MIQSNNDKNVVLLYFTALTWQKKKKEKSIKSQDYAAEQQTQLKAQNRRNTKPTTKPDRKMNRRILDGTIKKNQNEIQLSLDKVMEERI